MKQSLIHSSPSRTRCSRPLSWIQAGRRPFSASPTATSTSWGPLVAKMVLPGLGRPSLILRSRGMNYKFCTSPISAVEDERALPLAIGGERSTGVWECGAQDACQALRFARQAVVMAPLSAGGRSGDRYYTAYVTVPGAAAGSQSNQARWRAVAGALLVSIAILAVCAAGARFSRGHVSLAETKAGAAADAEKLGELSALAKEASANKRPNIVKRGQKLAWLNAGAVPDDNVFNQPSTWKAPDDPARPKPPASDDEYTTRIHPTGGLEIVHSTDNGSPVGDSFGIDRTSDDVFHGSAPSPPPPVSEIVYKIPQGDQFKITDPTDTGVAKTSTFTAFTIDTSTDDFFTHHANPASQCFAKVDDKYLADWFVSKVSYAKDDAMTLCSVTKDCGGITKQEGYFGGLGFTLRHGKVPLEVIDPSGTIDADLDLSRSCGPDRDAACATSQSSTDGEGVAGKANNGFTSGDYADLQCSLTSAEKNPYWLEDFSRKVRITELKVYGRSDDAAGGLEGFRVRASDKPDLTAPSHLCASVSAFDTQSPHLFFFVLVRCARRMVAWGVSCDE